MNKVILENIKSATVAIATLHIKKKNRPFTIIGSGFCIHPKGIVVTCEHVLSAFMEKSVHEQIAEVSRPDWEGKKDRIEIKTLIPHAIFYNNKISPHQLFLFPVPLDIAMAKTDFDLGMIRLNKHYAFPNGFPFLKIGNHSDVYEGMEAWTCGFPLGNYLQDQLGTVSSSFTKGIVSSVIPAAGVALEYLEGYQLNLTATHGNSGGPVFFPKTGKIFGVLQKGVLGQDGNLLQGITKAEPIHPVFEHNSIKRILETPKGQIPNID